jgi:LPS-assembly protein
MRTLRPALLFLATCLAVPARAAAQQPPSTDTVVAERHEIINEREHHYTGKVELELNDTKLYADDVRIFVDLDRAVATGNVVFRQGSSQIAADRADFNTKTRLGTFYDATGFATVQPPTRPASPGVVAPPPMTGQDTVVYFIGETVEKIGPRKYEIVNGGFTTCVQPTPRWNFTADTIVLNLDHYTLLRNVVMTVKGVPLFYLPALYYPTQRGDRATGFLLPTYGTSSLRGQSFHNAFFWAIDRSQDATFMHDWFSKTGQGIGSEYRYNFGGGSDGDVRGYFLNENETTRDGQLTGATKRSYRVNAAANELLPLGLRARASVDYFSDIVTNQTLNTNINTSSNNQRSIGGNVVGAWGDYSLNGTLLRSEYFSSQNVSNVTGSWPRVTVNRNERPVGDTPVYVSASGEYANVLSLGRNAATELDRSLTRLDFSPQLRFPFKRWQWLTANSTAGWRETFYSRSLDPAATDPVTEQPVIIGDNLHRRYAVLQTQLTGPVFNRIWDTPDNGYAERFKHTIEPYLNVGWTSVIPNSHLVLDNTDRIVGGSTSYTYGVRNRFYAKRRPAAAGQISQAREIFTVELRQSYHSNERAAQVDPQYSTSNSSDQPNNFTPISLTVRAQPIVDFNATARAEFDSRHRELRHISVNGTYSFSSQLLSTVGWSKRAFIAGLTGFDNPDNLDHSLNVSSTVRTRDNKYGSVYSLNYDILRETLLNQRITAFYNAQCCGIAFELQKAGFAGFSDRRFFLSFTLAGLGNFSPFNGALGGVPR